MRPQSVRSPFAALLQEAKTIEIFAEEIEVPPSRLQQYWDVSAELINLVAEIEERQRQLAALPSDQEEEILELRRRLRDIAARLSELELE